MKYYKFQGRVDKMSDEMFFHLKRNEPKVEELTKQEYENSMGIGQKGQKSKGSQDVRQPMGQSSEEQTEAQVPTEALTKKRIIELLEERGIEYDRQATKKQLLELF